MDDGGGDQDKLYKMLEKLQNMHNELPSKYQQRIPNELLSSLANSLMEGQVFEIVQMIQDVQHATEKQFFQQRLEVLKNNTEEKREFHDSIQINNESAEEINVRENKMIDKHDKEIKKNDMKLVLQLDQKVSEQQLTLERAGVPGFHVTNDPNEIRVQMYLIDMIQRLHQDFK